MAAEKRIRSEDDNKAPSNEAPGSETGNKTSSNKTGKSDPAPQDTEVPSPPEKDIAETASEPESEADNSDYERESQMDDEAYNNMAHACSEIDSDPEADSDYESEDSTTGWDRILTQDYPGMHSHLEDANPSLEGWHRNEDGDYVPDGPPAEAHYVGPTGETWPIVDFHNYSDDDEDYVDDGRDDEAKDDANDDAPETITNVRPGVKPTITADAARPSPLLQQLRGFLPQLKAANEELEKAREEGKLDERVIENVDEGDQYIELNLGLGVLEEKDPNKESSDSESEEEEDDDKPKEKDVMGKLLGKKAERKPGQIQEVED
ncbi:hypothetical protein EJ06DRAFT_88179 [Trichodelitschia bisporula]|uniref:Uncharacterized protein n=1 Tax=Trichodelitschia bisporula TaxID=703511 RepID=A0A6G1HRP6_9PEZI|nr:hypothetical protein EJ06DRAFT_88179 [Trichodelitschia bisporula]